MSITVFRNDTVVLLSRVVDSDDVPLVPSDVSSIEYTVYQLDESDPDSQVAVTGHTAVSASVNETIRDTLRNDELWNVDELGYNFKYALGIGHPPVFATGGGYYDVRFRLTRLSGEPVETAFRLKVI